MLDKQLVFEKAVCGIVHQGKPAISENGTCVYRSLDGLKCAIGMLIPDDKYDEDMEGRTPAMLFEEDNKPNIIARTVGAETTDEVQFLAKLQSCHDDNYEAGEHFVVAFKAAARQFGKDHDLDTFFINYL